MSNLFSADASQLLLCFLIELGDIFWAFSELVLDLSGSGEGSSRFFCEVLLFLCVFVALELALLEKQDFFLSPSSFKLSVWSWGLERTGLSFSNTFELLGTSFRIFAEGEVQLPVHFFLSELGDFFLGSTGLLLGLLRFHDALKLLDVRDVCCLVFVALEFFFWTNGYQIGNNRISHFWYARISVQMNLFCYGWWATFSSSRH